MKKTVKNLITSPKSAFTLAEVLITLAIIGVVAAMTIPNLVQNYKYKSYETGLKKAYSVFSQMIKLMMAENAASTLDQLDALSACASGDCQDVKLDPSNYMKVTSYTKTISYKNLGNESHVDFFGGADAIIDCANEDSNCYKSADGMIFNITTKRTHPSPTIGELYLEITVDINGENAPNQTGRDWFGFRVNNQGKLFGFGQSGIPYNVYVYGEGGCDTGSCPWQKNCSSTVPTVTTKEFLINDSGWTEEEFDNTWNAMTEEERKEMDMQVQTLIKGVALSGMACAGRIIETGKMDY